MIKLIAFDMDETFMRGKGVYDRARFSRIYAGLQERGIQILPISGDQYAQIASFFFHLFKTSRSITSKTPSWR